MATLFGRRWRVRVDTLDLDGMDISFSVEKSIKREPNKGKIDIYNLTPEHRAQIERLSVNKRRGPGRIRVELEAGYAEQVSLIFRGDMRTAVTAREGPDLITTIEGEDGGRAILWGRVNQSFPAGTPLQSVLRACASAMGVGVGNLTDVTAGLGFETGGGVTLAYGTVLSGAAHDELARLLRSMGLTYSVQNGVLQVLRRGRPLDTIGYLLSSSTGLLGRPMVNVDGTIRAQTLLIPDIVPGRRVIFDGFAGSYRVERASYSGDTSGADWYVDLECRAA